MDKKRAIEIANSVGMIDVTYNGKNIYIEDVHPRKETASIHFLDQPDKSQAVPLSELIENMK